MADHVLHSIFIGALVGLSGNGSIRHLTDGEREAIACALALLATVEFATRMSEFTSRISNEIKLAIKEEVLQQS